MAPDDVLVPRPAGDASFEVRLGELRRFARELRAQAEGLAARDADLAGLAGLSAREAVLGDFAEAESLASVHAQALGHVRELYRQVHGLLRFADDVAVEVADRYEHRDVLASEGYGGLGNDGPPPRAW